MMRTFPLTCLTSFGATVLAASCSLLASASMNPVADALKGVFTIAVSPSEYQPYYLVQVLGKYNYDQCQKQCPVVDLYLTVIGEGDPPEMESFFAGSGFAWKFEGWEELPQAPLTDSGNSVRLRLSRFPVGESHGARETLKLSIDFNGLRVLSQEETRN